MKTFNLLIVLVFGAMFSAVESAEASDWLDQMGESSGINREVPSENIQPGSTSSASAQNSEESPMSPDLAVTQDLRQAIVEDVQRMSTISDAVQNIQRIAPPEVPAPPMAIPQNIVQPVVINVPNFAPPPPSGNSNIAPATGPGAGGGSASNPSSGLGSGGSISGGGLVVRRP